MSNPVNVYDARADHAVVAAESPLAYSYASSGKPAPARHSRVVMAERAFLGHLILRGGAIVIDEALREVLGLGLPGRPNALTVADDGSYSVQWLSPDEWLLIVPGGEEFAVEGKLRQALGESHFAIVSVGGGQTVIELSGEAARDVLMKSTAYDVHPHAFPVGKGVTTCFAKTNVILRRPDETRWEIIVRRSFADYVYRWLLDAGEEYGIGVTRESHHEA